MSILIIDATNIFLRHYAAVPSLDMHGNPNGGVTGTLFCLKKLLSLGDFSKVIFAWDGAGGSKKRRAIIENYKQGRKPVKLNRNFEFENENPEENKLYQRVRLGQYLSDLPVIQVIVDDIEADDVIGYLVQHYSKERKVLVSNDNDFIQLLDPNTIIYNTAKKMFINSADAYKKYNIHPKNFALARAITGDKSDNIKGIKGVGLKTLLKMFPEFTGTEKIETEDFFNLVDDRLSTVAKNSESYRKFLEGKDIILDDLKVMRLDCGIISYNSIEKIMQCLENKVFLNSTSFRVKLVEDGMVNFSDSFFHPFRVLESKFKVKNNE